MSVGAPVIGFVARTSLRRAWRAAVAIAVMAGVVSGMVLWSWAAQRRGASALDRFVSHVAAPDFAAGFCEPDVTIQDLERDPELCRAGYDPVAELAVIAGLPGVEAAARRTTYVVRFELPNGTAIDQVPLVVSIDAGFATAVGDPRVVEGRLPDAADPDEIMMSPNAAKQTGLQVGDRVVVVPYDAGPFAAGELVELPGERHPVTLVGIVEGPADLLAVSALRSDPSRPSASSAWAHEHGEGAANYGTFVAVRFAGGNERSFRSAVGRSWPGRPVQIDTLQPAALPQLADAIRYESLGLALMAGIGALLALVFVGQAVWRQAGRDLADSHLYVVLGRRPSQVAAAAALRSSAPALLAASISALVAVGASSLAPVGQARRAELDAGTHVDLKVLSAGVAAVFASMVVLGIPPALLAIRSRSRPPASLSVTPWARWLTRIRPPEAAGLRSMVTSGMGRKASLVLALPGVVVASVLAVTALNIDVSFERLVADPARYGADWDLSIDGTGDWTDEDRTTLAAELTDSDEIDTAAGLIGRRVSIDGEAMGALAYDPVAGLPVVAPEVTAGRVPDGPGEVAVGATTMRRHGLHLGSTTALGLPDFPDVEPVQARVVGTAVINDSGLMEAGEGIVAAPEWLRTAFPVRIAADRYVVRLRDGVPPGTVIQELEGWGDIAPPGKQYGIRNLERIRWLPFALALMAGLLAIVVLLHALFVSSRAGRTQLAVLRAIGFTRGQVERVLAVQAAALALLGGSLGVVVGVRIGDQAWQIVRDRIGIESQYVSTAWMVTIPAAAVVLGVLFALVPGVLAARRSTAAALRAP